MTLTPLQFAVLTLIDRQTPGAAIREDLAVTRGIRKSGPAFYQAMARMEADGLIRGEYSRSVIDGQPITERVYTLTAKGRKSVEETREFYR